MSKDLLYFTGVRISENQLSGFITSDQLVKKFDKSWLPYYQRERVGRAKKISSLVNLFKAKGKIDSVTINVVGEFNYDGRKNEGILEGPFHVIDGQQRLWALQESKVTDLNIPVVLYVNLSDADAKLLFHQLNKEATKLTNGELAKSADGVFGVAARDLMRKKGSTAIPISINGSVTTLGLNLFGALLYTIHRRLYRDLKIMRAAHGKSLLQFFEDKTYPENEVRMTIFAARKLLEQAVLTFGVYDSKATPYRRSFFHAWCHVIIHNFLLENGSIETGKFRVKIRDIQSKLVLNAQIRELVSMGGDGAVDLLYNRVVDHLNHKLKGGHIPRTDEIVHSEKALQHMVGSARAKHLAHVESHHEGL